MKSAGLRCSGAVLTAMAAFAVAAAPAVADSGRQRIDNPWTEQDVTQVDGIGPGCPAFTGTLVEDLTGRDVGFLTADGIAHVHTTVEGQVTLSPDANSAPSYRGSYTMIQTGTYPDDGADTRVMTRTVNGTITGSDGTSYDLHETLHLSVDGRGTTRASFDHLACH